MGRGPKPAKSRVESKPTVSRRPPQNDEAKVRDLEKQLAEAQQREAEALRREAEASKREAEALEQQTATSEILRVISQSPTDVHPVFETIVQNAARLCDASDASLYQREVDVMRCVANFGRVASALVGETRPITRGTGSGRAILDRRTIHLPDVLADVAEFPDVAAAIRREGIRAVLSVPLLREGLPIGAITVRRTEARPYSDKQINLIETFADQAVIAIENVRLFGELEARNRDLTETLEQQTATSEILRVISSSPTDIQPVFDTIVRNAVRLCGALYGTVTRMEGNLIHLAAQHNLTPDQADALRRAYPVSLSSEAPVPRSMRAGTVYRARDVEAEPDWQSRTEEMRIALRSRGVRSHLAVPMMRQGIAIGAINLTHREVGAFSDAHVELVKTFADQAVIAIENVRLFTELQEKNRALTQAHAQVGESLEQQTATSDILRVISSSPTDVQPVFETIARSATTLCEADLSGLYHFDGDLIHFAAEHGRTPAETAAARRAFPQPPSGLSVTARAILTAAIVQVADVSEEPEVTDSLRMFRTVLSVPMLRDGRPLGAITVARRVVRPFTDKQIELLQTFADQAVIAIENVRLFKELEARTQDLTRSVGELRALGEVGQAISSTLDLQTVLSTIAARATNLSGTDAGVIYEYDDRREVFLPRATAHLEAEIVETMLATPVRRGEGATGRLAEAPEPIQVTDILAAPAESRVRGALVRAGYRALLAVPLVREDHLLGGLTVIRKATGEFTPEVIDLMRTFATQSALAIQNARLFLEIEDKSRQLEVASRHKSEFMANMSHELRTPLNAIIGFSEVLSERMFGELNEKQEEYLKDIYASGQHLLSLINDILDLSKIEAGRMELELTDFHLPTALDSALTLVRERAGRRGITLRMNVDSRLGQIQADERKVRQVVLNLLSNAIKFTPEGGQIEVAAAPRDGSVEVSVSDTGVGIAPEDRETVFEEFRQVGTAAKKVEGTGLGLTLCRKFVELHGGRIWVKSEVGVGSTFTFSLPLRSA